MKDVIIVGASGFGKIAADAVLCAGDNLLGFLDDNPERLEFFHRSVLGKSADYVNFPNAYFLVAIGNGKIREKIVSQMKDARWYIAIHPSAVISPYDTEIGAGSVILPNAVIDPGAKIGKHCLINCSAVVAHDCIIGDYCHISVGTKLAGNVIVDQRTWVGIGATISNDISICSDCMIGAGAVVVKNIEESGTYVGVPAKRIK